MQAFRHSGIYEVADRCIECAGNGPVVTVIAGLILSATVLVVILTGYFLWFLAIVHWRWLFEFLADSPERKG